MSNNESQQELLFSLCFSQINKKGEANLWNKGITNEEEIDIVCTYIKSHEATSLLSLNLYYNEGLGNKGGEEICIALTLSQYCKLQYLYLGRTGIGGMNSMKALGEYLISPSSSHLSTLDLGGNKKIGKKKGGVKILCSALSLNSSLSSLSLKGSGIDDRGALMLQYLYSNYNSSLDSLYLNDNHQIDKNFQIRIERIGNKYKNYHRICHIIHFRLKYPQSKSSSSSSSSEELGVNLSNTDQRKILQYLQQIFEPLPSYQISYNYNNNDNNYDNNNNNNNNNSNYDDSHYNHKRKLITMGGYDEHLQMIISLNSSRNCKNRNRFKSLFNINSFAIFKWKILLICSIINSFT